MGLEVVVRYLVLVEVSDAAQELFHHAAVLALVELRFRVIARQVASTAEFGDLWAQEHGKGGRKEEQAGLTERGYGRDESILSYASGRAAEKSDEGIATSQVRGRSP